ARKLDPDAPRRLFGRRVGGHFQVVVFRDQVFLEDRAARDVRGGELDVRRVRFVRVAHAVLRRRSVARVFTVRDDPGGVVPEGRFFDHEAPTGVRPGVADRVVFDRRFGDTGFTFPARAQVDARVVVAGGVDVFPFAFLLVLGEDPVAAVHRRVVGGQVLADPSVRALLFGALAAVPVEGVALRPVGARTVVVARSHVFDRDVVGLQDLDPVAAAGGGFAFAVEDHGVAVHPADVDSAVGARDEDFFVVGAGLDQDPVAV